MACGECEGHEGFEGQPREPGPAEIQARGKHERNKGFEGNEEFAGAEGAGPGKADLKEMRDLGEIQAFQQEPRGASPETLT